MKRAIARLAHRVGDWFDPRDKQRRARDFKGYLEVEAMRREQESATDGFDPRFEVPHREFVAHIERAIEAGAGKNVEPIKPRR